MSDCLFCRIAAGQIPAEIVAETPTTIAFADVNPGAPVHMLVIPREHIESIEALTPDHGPLLAEIFSTVRKVAEGMGLARAGYRVVANYGEDGGMTVGHLHLHVLGGRKLNWPPG